MIRKELHVPNTGSKDQINYMYLKQEVKELIVYNSEMDRMSI